MKLIGKLTDCIAYAIINLIAFTHAFIITVLGHDKRDIDAEIAAESREKIRTFRRVM